MERERRTRGERQKESERGERFIHIETGNVWNRNERNKETE